MNAERHKINVAGESIEGVDKGCSGMPPSDGGFLRTQHPTVYGEGGTPASLHPEGVKPRAGEEPWGLCTMKGA